MFPEHTSRFLIAQPRLSVVTLKLRQKNKIHFG